MIIEIGGEKMPRNYKKESEWENKKYKRLVAKIDRELAEKFLENLKKPYSVWVKEEIENFLKKN